MTVPDVPDRSASVTLGIVAAIGAAATDVWEQVHRGVSLARWDAPTTSWAIAHREPTLTLVARAVTDLASSTGVLVLTSVLVLLLAWHRRWRLAVGWPPPRRLPPHWARWSRRSPPGPAPRVAGCLLDGGIVAVAALWLPGRPGATARARRAGVPQPAE